MSSRKKGLLDLCAVLAGVDHAGVLFRRIEAVLAGCVCCALFLLFLYHQGEWTLRRPKQYVLTLAALPWLGLMSYPALLMMGLPLINLLLSVSRKEESSFRHLLFYAGSMTVALVVSYMFDMRLRPVEAVTGYSDYFVSTAGPAEFFKTTFEGTNNLFSRWMAESPRVLKKISRVFFAFGLIYLFYGFFKSIRTEKRLKSVNTAALVMFAGLFVLGLAHKYSFGIPRTALFFLSGGDDADDQGHRTAEILE